MSSSSVSFVIIIVVWYIRVWDILARKWLQVQATQLLQFAAQEVQIQRFDNTLLALGNVEKGVMSDSKLVSMPVYYGTLRLVRIFRRLSYVHHVSIFLLIAIHTSPCSNIPP